jgi:hypothetical protein
MISGYPTSLLSRRSKVRAAPNFIQRRVGVGRDENYHLA